MFATPSHDIKLNIDLQFQHVGVLFVNQFSQSVDLDDLLLL
jgi:hypothetical protein